MPQEERKRIASLGGKAAHALGRAHRWSPEEASKAGRIGGKIGRRGPSIKQRGNDEQH